MAEYKSKFTGAEIDDGVAKARAAVVMQGTPDTLTWDGNTEGLVSIDLASVGMGMVYNIFPSAPTYQEMMTATINAAGEVSSNGNGMMELENGGSSWMGVLMFIPYDGYEVNGIVFPTAGVWTSVVTAPLSLTIPGYTGFAQEKIAPSHLYQSDFAQTDESRPNAIKNLPFGDYPTGGDTLTWDVNMEGLLCVADMFYKVSDAVLTMDDLSGGYLEFASADGLMRLPLNDAVEVVPGAIIAMTGMCFFIAPEAVGVDLEGLVFPEAGVYLTDFQGVVAHITIPGYTGFPAIKKLERKFLPGAAIFHTDGTYLYNTEDTSDETNRTTLAEFLDAAFSGVALYVHIAENNANMYTQCKWFGYTNAAIFVSSDDKSYYTAEYTGT